MAEGAPRDGGLGVKTFSVKVEGSDVLVATGDGK